MAKFFFDFWWVFPVIISIAILVMMIIREKREKTARKVEFALEVQALMADINTTSQPAITGEVEENEHVLNVGIFVRIRKFIEHSFSKTGSMFINCEIFVKSILILAFIHWFWTAFIFFILINFAIADMLERGILQ